MKTRIFALALCATVLAGCDAGAGTEGGQTLATDTVVSTPEKPDFAGVSFKMKKSDFEREGYLCKDTSKDGKTTTDCENFDVKTSVFGQDVKGVSVNFREGANTPSSIATELPVEYSNFAKRNGLVMRIEKYYTSLPEQDISSAQVELKRWKRNDGAVLQLMTFVGIPGIMEPSVSIRMFSVEDSSGTTE